MEWNELSPKEQQIWNKLEEEWMKYSAIRFFEYLSVELNDNI
jgi:hypothetical protein